MIICIILGRATLGFKTEMDLETYLLQEDMTMEELESYETEWRGTLAIYDVNERIILVGKEYDDMVSQFLESMKDEPLLVKDIPKMDEMLNKLKGLEWDKLHDLDYPEHSCPGEQNETRH